MGWQSDGWLSAQESAQDYWRPEDYADIAFLADLYSKCNMFELVCRHTNNCKKIVLPIGVFQGLGADANDFAAFVAAELQKHLVVHCGLKPTDWVESNIVSVDGVNKDLFEIELLVCEVL